ncbi:hypothetical protein D3C81_1205800 [compost metagenome]
MSVEFYFGEDLRVQADFLAVEQSHLSPNDPLLFHPLNPSPARGLRQADLFGDLRTGQRSVLLQQREYLAVITVQLDLHE